MHPSQATFTCTVSSCTEQNWEGFTTCRKHSQLLLSINVYPERNITLREGFLAMDYQTDVLDKDEPVQRAEPLRFSASYADRYHNCHGSANLHLAIPGFEFPERNNDGMKGEGSRLHEIFEVALSEENSPTTLRSKATLLKELAELHFTKRTPLLNDERLFITWWFSRHKSLPPLELKDLQPALLHKKPKLNTKGEPELTEDGMTIMVNAGAPPRRLVFLAEALEYVADIIENMDPESLEVLTEVKATAEWLKTKPKTTVDLILRDNYAMHVLDLKMGEIEISPIENVQLSYYAVTFDAYKYADGVQLHLLQRGNIDSWHASAEYLNKFEDDLVQSETDILNDDLTLTVGEHCKFCPANPHGRGDRGNKACPVMMFFLYGERDALQSDLDVLEGDEDD